MKRIAPTHVIVLASLLFSGVCRAADQPTESIHWENSFEDAAALAVKQNKPLLLEFYSTGCGWCKRMEKTIHPYPPAIELIRQEFVAVRLSGRKDLRDRYHIPGNPATIVIDPQSLRVIHRTYGYLEPWSYVLMLKLAAEDHHMMMRHPEMADAYLNVTQQISDGRLSQAGEQLDELTRRYPREGMLWTHLCVSAFESAQFDRAITAGRRAVALPGVYASTARYELAAAYMCTNNYAAAAPLLEQNVDDPVLGDGWYELSLLWVCASIQKREDAVVRLARQHVEAVARKDDSWWQRWVVLYQIGRISEKELVDLAAKHGAWRVTQAHYFVAVRKLADGDQAAAIQELDKSIRSHTPSLDVHRMAVALRTSLKSQ